MLPANILSYIRNHSRRFVTELKDFIRFPSVSSQPKHSNDLKKCAAWLANHLRRIGLEGVKFISTPRHPIVYAEWKNAPGQPTILIYGHYDVMPSGPLKEWHTPPFEPLIKGRNIYGRGASDDKGQLFAQIKALETYLHTVGKLPVNIKCLFEGEEEIGSSNLIAFLKRNRRSLAADAAVISDVPIIAPDLPAITYALRGVHSLELEVHGPKQNVHSGCFAGAIHNPLQALCEIIAKLHDAEGRLTIPGFYGRVRQWSEKERDFMTRNGPTDAKILQDAQSERSWGERGYTLYERTTIRPALVVGGIAGSNEGPGGEGAIPASAVAKISFRLAPNQTPDEIERLFRQYISRITPSTVRSTVRSRFSAHPVVVDRRHPAVQAAAVAYRKGFGTKPAFLRSGGTIPVVDSFQEMLGIPTVLMGFALPDDRKHAPNEKFHLPNFFNGIATSIWFLNEILAV